MERTARLGRWGGGRVARRLLRSIPFVGAVVAVALVGRTVRRKGLARGVADTGLNALPFVGAAKTLAEAVRGRDFLPDRPEPRRRRRG